jgi:hypothetical protein
VVADVVVEVVIEHGPVGGIGFVLGIRVGAHGVEGERRDGERVGFVEVHVFHEAVGEEEVVALPAMAERRRAV